VGAVKRVLFPPYPAIVRARNTLTTAPHRTFLCCFTLIEPLIDRQTPRHLTSTTVQLLQWYDSFTTVDLAHMSLIYITYINLLRTTQSPAPPLLSPTFAPLCCPHTPRWNWAGCCGRVLSV